MFPTHLCSAGDVLWEDRSIECSCYLIKVLQLLDKQMQQGALDAEDALFKVEDGKMGWKKVFCWAKNSEVVVWKAGLETGLVFCR